MKPVQFNVYTLIFAVFVEDVVRTAVLDTKLNKALSIAVPSEFFKVIVGEQVESDAVIFGKLLAIDPEFMQ